MRIVRTEFDRQRLNNVALATPTCSSCSCCCSCSYAAASTYIGALIAAESEIAPAKNGQNDRADRAKLLLKLYTSLLVLIPILLLGSDYGIYSNLVGFCVLMFAISMVIRAIGRTIKAYLVIDRRRADYEDFVYRKGKNRQRAWFRQFLRKNDSSNTSLSLVWTSGFWVLFVMELFVGFQVMIAYVSRSPYLTGDFNIGTIFVFVWSIIVAICIFEQYQEYKNADKLNKNATYRKIYQYSISSQILLFILLLLMGVVAAFQNIYLYLCLPAIALVGSMLVVSRWGGGQFVDRKVNKN